MKKDNKNHNEAYELGKLPPQAIELEEAILGALMLEANAIDRIDIRPEYMYKPAHQIILSAIQNLSLRNEPIDILTVTEELRKNDQLDEVGGPLYVTILSSKVASASHIEYHSKVIIEKFVKREMIRISSEIQQRAFDETEDTFEVLDDMYSQLDKLNGNTFETDEPKTWQELLQETTKKAQEREKDFMNGKKTVGIPTPLATLTRWTRGWQPKQFIILAGRPGMGKCLGKGTKVIMFDGAMKNVEDVRVGDLLMGDDSTPRRVLSLARGREMMYWIRQNQGIDYLVNESHILSLKCSGTEGKRIHGAIENITVKDYISKSEKYKIRRKGYKVPIYFQEQLLPIDPYFLGIWLGDGSSKDIRITNPDKEVSEYLEDYASELGLSYKEYYGTRENDCKTISITRGNCKGGSQAFSLQQALTRLNLINNKHIPHIFINNSYENRLKLLAGLIDSDGYLYDNCFEITQKNKNLAYQIKYISDTLGFKTIIKEKKATIKKQGFSGIYYRLMICGNVEIIPTLIPRKKAADTHKNKDWRVTGIKVEPYKVGDYYGFEIDGNKLFLLEDGTVTHNTAWALGCLKTAAEHGYKPAMFSLEMADTNLADRIIIGDSGINADDYRRGNIGETNWSMIDKALNKLSRYNILIDDKPKSINRIRTKVKTLHRKGKCNFVLVDYLQLVNDDSVKNSANREQEISVISRKLKILASELDIPVMALSQLNRDVERRPDKKPMLADLRESGSLEQDADVVIFIYRPEKYGFENGPDDKPLDGRSFVILEKQREGETGMIPFRYNSSVTAIYDYEEGFTPETPQQLAGNVNKSTIPERSFEETVRSFESHKPNDIPF